MPKGGLPIWILQARKLLGKGSLCCGQLYWHSKRGHEQSQFQANSQIRWKFLTVTRDEALGKLEKAASAEQNPQNKAEKVLVFRRNENIAVKVHQSSLHIIPSPRQRCICFKQNHWGELIAYISRQTLTQNKFILYIATSVLVIKCVCCHRSHRSN